MANNPTPTPEQDPFKQKYKTPRDLLLDPKFYDIGDVEVRRSLLSEIDPAFGEFDIESQNKALSRSLQKWQQYYTDKDEAAKPKPPGFMDRVISAGKDIFTKGGAAIVEGAKLQEKGIRSLLAPPDQEPQKPAGKPATQPSKPSVPVVAKPKPEAKILPIPGFDPEGIDYDMDSAVKAGLTADETGHWPSRDPKTGMLLKGRKHPTWDKTVEAEAKMGNSIFQKDGRYYSQPINASAPNKEEIIKSARQELKYDPFRQISGISANKSAPLGLFDLAKELITPQGMNRFPFAGSVIDGIELYDIYRAAQRVDEGKGTPYDEQILGDYEAKEVERQVRGETFAYKVANLVSHLPGFALEFMATGGAFSGTKKSAEKVLESALRKLAKKKAAQALIKTGGAAAGAAAQTALMPQRVATGALERMVPQVSVEKNERGEIVNVLRDKGDDFVTAIARALPDVFIEVASERTGGAVPSAGKVASKALQKLPYADRIMAMKAAIAKRWFQLNPDKGWKELLEKVRSQAAWNGVLGEIFEERVGELARDVSGINKPEEWSALTRLATGVDPIPTGNPAIQIRAQALADLKDQLLVEGTAFAVPGAVGSILSYRPSKGAQPRTPIVPKPPGIQQPAPKLPPATPVSGTEAPPTSEAPGLPAAPDKYKTIVPPSPIRGGKAEAPGLPPPPAEETTTPPAETPAPVPETVAPPAETIPPTPETAPVPGPEAEIVAPPSEEVTIPEKPATVISQIETIGAGGRSVVYVPESTLQNWQKQDLINDFLQTVSQNPNIGAVNIPGKGMYFFDPRVMTEDDIQLAVDAGKDHELMGILDAKSSATSIGVYVEKWNPDTNSWDEFMSVVTKPEDLRAQVRLLKQQTEGQGKFRFLTGPAEDIAQKTIDKRTEPKHIPTPVPEPGPTPAEELAPPTEEPIPSEEAEAAPEPEPPAVIAEPEKKALVPPPSTELETKRPTLQIKDGKIKTVSGREIPAPPPIRLDTDRKASSDVKKVDSWLLDQALQEAEDRNDDFNKTQFQGLDPKKLSPADKDILNQYLFGHEDPEILSEQLAPPPTEGVTEPTPEPIPATPPESKIEEEPPAPSVIDEIKTKIKDDFPDWSQETVDAEAEKAMKGFGPWAPGRTPKLAEIEKKAMGWKPKGEPGPLETPPVPEGSGNILEPPPETPEPVEPAEPEEITREAQFKSLISQVKTSLANGEKFNNPKLQQMANEIFGGARGEGKYTLRDMYDAFEGGVSAYIEESGIVDFGDPVATLERLEELQNRLAVQSDRTTEQIDLQQFSTPPMQAFVAAYALGSSSAPLLGLEPSAGTGMLATMLRIKGMQVRANEIDPRRVTILKLRNFTTSEVDALHLTTTGHDLSDVDPDVVLMNPPFSAGPGKMHGMEFGARHVLNALQKMNPGGRLVAIVGDGMGHGRNKFNKWWGNIQSQYNVRADLGLSGKYYAKMGTTYDNRVIVIDKTGPTPGSTNAERSANVIISNNLSPAEAAQRLFGLAHEDIHERLTRPKPSKGITPPPEDAGTLPRPEEPISGPGDLQPGVSGGRPGVPTDIGPGSSELGPVPSEGVREPGGSLPSPPPDNDTRELAGTRTTEPGERLGGGLGDAVSGSPGSVAPVEITLEEERKELGEEETDAYVKYQVRKARYKDSVAHPADLIESATLGSVESPNITTTLNLPIEVIKEGRLSAEQLETVTYAVQRFSHPLPDGRTPGFWVGDGTGVGKGREIAGIIYHFLRESGQKKALWISATQQLYQDAKRDIAGVGVPLQTIHHNESKYAKGAPIEAKEGILFSQYGTAAAGWKGKRDRFNQIVNWLSPQKKVDSEMVSIPSEFEGVIVYDECHAMKNAVGTNQGGASTKATGTDRGEMGLLLSETFPKAKIVYVSATGATLVHNMAYMNRLGLWGKGAAFSDFDAFMSAMNAGGLGAMEMLSRDLKAIGAFMSRQISYRGVNYDYVNHELNEYQLEQYNKSASLWSKLITKMEDAEKNANQKRDGGRYSQFYSTQQRFFLMLMTTYQMHSVLQHMEESLKKGMAPIVNILSTNETLMKKQVAKAEAAGKDIEDLDLGPRQMIRAFIESYFPLEEHEDVPDPDNPGKTINMPTGEINQENLRMQQELLDELEYLNLPDNPIDMVSQRLGGWGKVAEVSGRTERIENGKLVRRKPPGKKTGETVNNAELRRFQNGEADVLIITGAGSAGISAQAEKGIPTQNKRRIMYCAQLSWSADQQMQFFGRAHRSNQTMPPVIMLVKTNVKGQQRLINAVSRRLASLGAVTQGNRESLGGSLFDIEDLTDNYGRAALMSFTHDLFTNGFGVGEMRGMDILKLMGWLTKNDGLKPGVDTNVEGFLNRIMVLPVDVQNKVFDEFYSRFTGNVAVAKDQGTFDTGVSKVRGSNISVSKEEIIYTHPGTEARTKFIEMEGDFKVDKIKWDNVPRGADFLGFVVNNKSGKIYAVHNYVDPQTGQRQADLRGVRASRHKIDIPDLNENYKVVEGVSGRGPTERGKLPEPPRTRDEVAKELWDKEFAEIPEVTRKPLYMITGAITPVYDKIIGNKELHNCKIVRAVLKDGSPVIGMQVRPNEIGPLKTRLGLGNDFVNETGLSIFNMVREGATVELDNGWRLYMTQPIHGERRMEINLQRAYKESTIKILQESGAITEIIVGGESRRPRAFVPLDDVEGPKLLDKIFERNKPVRVIAQGETRSISGNINPTSSSSMGLTIEPSGNRYLSVGRGDVPESVDQAKEAARFWLKQAQDAIDNIMNDRGTVDDQLVVHQNPVIAKHIMNWLKDQDSSQWLNERVYVDSVIEEVTDYVTGVNEYDANVAKTEAIHYFPYVESMMDDLANSDKGIPIAEGPEEVNDQTLAMASPPTSPIIPPPPTATPSVGYSAPPTINPKDLVSRNQILSTLAKKLQVPIRYGRFRVRALGIFKIDQEAIRLKKAQDVKVASHEVGHAINKLLWGKRGGQLNWQPLVPYRQELEAIATKPMRGQSKLPEGFAEYIRYWITEPSRAATVAPGVHTFFEGVLAQNADLKTILEEARRDYDRWNKQSNSAKVLSHISVDDPGYDRVNWFERFYTGAVNRLYPIEAAVRYINKGNKLSTEEDPGQLSQLLSGWAAKAEHFLNIGTFDPKLDVVKGTSLKTILEPMKDRLDDLRITATALRVLEKKGLQGIDVGISVKEAQETLREQGFDPNSFYGSLAPSAPGMPTLIAYDPNSLIAMTPEAQTTKEALLQLYAYQDDLLRYYQKAGMLSADQYIKIKLLNQFFVPFHRLYEAGAGEKATESKAKSGSSTVNLWQPVRKMVGSWRPIIDPLESIVKNTYTLINIAERNMVGQSLANLSNIEGAGAWIEGPLPSNLVPQPFALQRIRETLEKAGVDLSDPNLNLDEIATIFVPNSIPMPKENIITVFFNGKPQMYQLERNLYRAVVGLDRAVIGPMMKILAFPASMLRLGATGINPEFASRNLIRDMFIAWAQTDVGFIPGVDTLKGLAHVINKDKVYEEWMRSGAPHSGLASIDRAEFRKKLNDLGRGKISYAIHHPIDTLRILSEVSETMTRVALYERYRKAGYSIKASGVGSREGTLDFQRIGGWMVGVNMTIPFFNANVQGIDKFIRVHKDNPKKAMIKGATFAMISLIVYMLNKDDERYREAPWWLRDLFWLFPTKGIPGLSEKTPWIPIPKPFIWTMFYGNPVERFAEYVDTKDPHAFDEFFRNLLQDIAPGILPTAFKNPLELFFNKNTFTGRPIESSWQQEHYSPQYRSNWYTSYFAQQMALGLAKVGIKISPLMIEHAMFSSLGGTARIATKVFLDPATKILIPPKGGELPASTLVDIPILKSFAVRYPHASLRSIDIVQDEWDKINQLYKDRKQSNKENNRFNIEPLTKDELRKYGILKSSTRRITAINREIHRIILSEKDKDGNIISGEEKRKKIDIQYNLMLDESRKTLKRLGIREFKDEKWSSKIVPEGLLPPPED